MSRKECINRENTKERSAIFTVLECRFKQNKTRTNNTKITKQERDVRTAVTNGTESNFFIKQNMQEFT